MCIRDSLLNHPKLNYLDSAATSLKPQRVLDAMMAYYTQYGVNVHRGLYELSEEATARFEESRDVIARHIHASSSREIICTKNATEAINLIASTIGRDIIDSKDVIVSTIIDHHANFVPWQQLAFDKGAEFRVIDCLDSGDLDIYDQHGELDLSQSITDAVRIVALPYVSNVLGIIQPIKEIIAHIRLKQPHVIIVVDASQALAHISVDVQDLDCDFLVFSGHKMYGPTGIGILWGRESLLKQMRPYMFGGDMVSQVHIESTTWADIPYRFEAGTPPIAEMIGLGEACRCIEECVYSEIKTHDFEMSTYLLDRLSTVDDQIRVLASESKLPRIGIASFYHPQCHPHDIASLLSEDGIAVRAGHHCAMPLHTRFTIPATTRVSISPVTTQQDIDSFIQSLIRAISILCPSTKK